MPAKKIGVIHHASGIYGFFNTVTGKSYVGSALDLYARLRYHLCHLRKGDHKNKHLQASWMVHGESAFVWAVLEYVPDKMQLLRREQEWIDCLDSAYNKSRIAGGCHGVKATKEKRAKISASLKKKYREDKEFRKSQSERLARLSNTEEEKKRRSLFRKKQWEDPEYRAKIIAANKGKKVSDKTRAKMRKAQRKRYEEHPEQLEALKAQAKRAIESRWRKRKEV